MYELLPKVLYQSNDWDALVTEVEGKFDLVISCIELPLDIPRVPIIRFPFIDGSIIPNGIDIVAGIVSDSIRRNNRTLVHCMRGNNRSGLVSALALLDYYKSSNSMMCGDEAIKYIQGIIPTALSNTAFCDYIRKKYP